jgi:two-component system, sensor histidine kinase and response regulator
LPFRFALRGSPVILRPLSENAPPDRAIVLVVEDDAASRNFVRAALKAEGYEVVVAASGEEAIVAFAEQVPDCILLDVRMPGMDGFATCERIRALPEGADVPVVFLTAHRDIDTFDRALRAGGDDFLTKPIRPTELAIRVQIAVKLRRTSAELREHYTLLRGHRDELLRLQLQKEQLTAYVVHDLKNPLNAINLHAQLLARNRNLPETARPSLQQIRDEVQAIMRLLHNLLDIQKSEEGRLAPRRERIELRVLAGQVFEPFELRAQSKHVKLAAEIAADCIMADADLIRRVLENLVDNALRYTPEESRVVLAARPLEAHVEISVADQGPGIAEALREKVFDRYVQLESHADSSRAGRGLGLAFCKLAVEAHGGTISLEQGDPGSVFRVRLPLMADDAA